MAQVLRYLPDIDDPRVLVATLTRDDAAVYRISDDRAIVATVDFFTPIVDDAYVFGAITATNALSDLYAMGATPLFALSLVAWPRDPDVMELIGPATRGLADKAREAGIFILGGHSIEDREPKLGMVAVGEAHPSHLLSIAGAQVGDLLVLTKPIGTGILATGLKQSAITELEMAEAIRTMTMLNAGAMAAARHVGSAVHAATDITGFGLLGHLHSMMVASRVAAVIDVTAVPLFDGVRALAGAGAIPGGTKRNAESAGAYTTWDPEIDTVARTIMCDAQTSGGLLCTVAAEAAADLVAALREQHTPSTAVIGKVVSGVPGTIEVHGGRERA